MRQSAKPSKNSIDGFTADFTRLGVVFKPGRRAVDREGTINPASARLRDGSLRLYPRMIARGNISRIGCFRAHESSRGALTLNQCGYALIPATPYELRDESDGYGCEDPRITYIKVIGRYVLAYVAFGPRGPEVAAAVSRDGVAWKRLGLIRFQYNNASVADKDAAFFPEPIISPSGAPSLALYHRPTLWSLWRKHGKAAVQIIKRSRKAHEHISIAYIPLAAVRKDLRKLCEVRETHPLHLPAAGWGQVKVGGGTPPVRIREGWLSVMHGVDECHEHRGQNHLRYSAGIIIQDATRLDQVIYRSPTPLFVPELPSEIRGRVGHVVFPTAIDPRPDLGERTFDIYYGMGDRRTGRGRLTLSP